MALNSFFGWNSTDESNSERQPLISRDGQQEGAAGYGSTSNPRAFVVPKPPKVKTPVRVETKVWLANEVGRAMVVLYRQEEHLTDFERHPLLLVLFSLPPSEPGSPGFTSPC